MQIRELAVPDSYEITPVQHADERGVFLEWYRFDRLQDVVGHPLTLRQGNLSVSAKGVLRGIHYADVPNGQAKYVTAVKGAVLDYVIDLRVGSATFGQWDSVLLDDVDRRAVYLAEGLGHAFLSLSEGATVSYLVSDVYNPASEHGISPLDSELGLEFPPGFDAPLLSRKDQDAETLASALSAGRLPTFESAAARYSELNQTGTI